MSLLLFVRGEGGRRPDEGSFVDWTFHMVVAVIDRATDETPHNLHSSARLGSPSLLSPSLSESSHKHPSRKPHFDSTKHFARMHQWLAMEGEAERERMALRRKTQSTAAAERSGETLLDLVIRSQTTGLGGRYLLTLAKRRSPDQLPWHRFKVGSRCCSPNKATMATRCRVLSARGEAIRWKSRLMTGQRANGFDWIYRRMKSLANARPRLDIAERATGRLRQVARHSAVRTRADVSSEREDPRAVSARLNPSQHEAIRQALAATIWPSFTARRERARRQPLSKSSVKWWLAANECLPARRATRR